MAVIIEKIELNNWFGYKGNYEENLFSFKEGLNVIVAANDIGKSKLHNAFRWILNDTIILKKQKEKGFELTTINEQNIKKVINQTKQRHLSEGESIKLGVRLTFKETFKDGIREDKSRILLKELHCKKQFNEIVIIREERKVLKLEHNNPRTSSEDFEELKKRVVKPSLQDFFLVQGESLENMTILSGVGLRKTINNLVSIDILDAKCQSSKTLLKNIVTLKRNTEDLDNRNNSVIQNNIKSRIELEERISDIKEKDLFEEKEFLKIQEETISKFKENAELTKLRTQQKNVVDSLNLEIREKQGQINSFYKRLIENYINKEFYFSKLIDINSDIENVRIFRDNLRALSAKRRSELDDTISKEEQLMLYALQKDQPSPEILAQMVEKETCYVCTQKMTEYSKDYIKNKLIPYFKNELNKNDTEINKYVQLNNLFIELERNLQLFNYYDIGFIDNLIDEIVVEEALKREIEDQKYEFIKETGIDSNEEIDDISLITYDTAIKDKLNSIARIKELEEELKTKESKLIELSSLSSTTEVSPKLQKYIDLENFGAILKEELFKLRNNEYLKFTIELEKIISNKFKAFSEVNPNFHKQKLKVNFWIENNSPEFEISVVDDFGNNYDQGGGASQALRQLAVILGLVEISGGEADFPFIADAPTSNMTSSLTEAFFNYQLLHSKNQNILITKEFWNDKIHDLNEIGYNLLEKIKQNPNSRMLVLKLDQANTSNLLIETLS